jgi:hypothetical protein
VALGEDGWPEFKIPDEGNPGGEPQASGSGVSSDPAPVAAAPKEPAGTPAPAGEAPNAGDTIPKYRFDETSERARRAEEANAKLLELLATRPAEKPAPGEPDPEQERRARLLAQLIELDPRIGKMLELAEHADKLTGIMTDSEQRQIREKQEWDAHATRTLGTVHDAFAKAFSGGKKAGADLPAEMRQTLTDNFVAWVMRDPTGQRAQRYDRKDDKLASEFVSDWRTNFVEPFRRETVAGQVTQARKVANLPVGGGSSSPLGTPAPKPNDGDDEDAIFKRGWAQTKQAMEQSS